MDEKYLNSIIPLRRKWFLQLVKLHLSTVQMHIMLCVFDKTYGYVDAGKQDDNKFRNRKTEAYITYQEMRDYTMVKHQSNLKREVKNLIAKGVLLIDKEEKQGAVFAPNTNFSDHLIKIDKEISDDLIKIDKVNSDDLIKIDKIPNQFRLGNLIKIDKVNPEEPDGCRHDLYKTKINKKQKKTTTTCIEEKKSVVVVFRKKYPEIFNQLKKWGIKNIDELIDQYTEAKIIEKYNLAAKTPRKNVAGFLIQALKDDYIEPVQENLKTNPEIVMRGQITDENAIPERVEKRLTKEERLAAMVASGEIVAAKEYAKLNKLTT